MHDWEDEMWREIPSCPGYQVSNYGRVKSFKSGRGGYRAAIHPNGYLLKPSLDDQGRPQIISPVVDGKPRKRKVHTLVAEAFLVKPPGDGLEIRHLDDVKTNNHVSNLAWGTSRDNALDNVRNGNHNNARKTTCPQGHPYDLFHTRPSGQKISGCRRCRLGLQRKRTARIREGSQ